MNSHALDFSMAAVIVVAALGPHTSYAQSLEERVQDLERRVLQLESKEKGAPMVSVPTRGRSDGWRNQANWRALKRGMSQDEVRSFLGEPQRVDAGPITLWHYPSGGDVHFDNRGALMGWSEPR
jgi:hypothetical protein